MWFFVRLPARYAGIDEHVVDLDLASVVGKDHKGPAERRFLIKKGSYVHENKNNGLRNTPQRWMHYILATRAGSGDEIRTEPNFTFVFPGPCWGRSVCSEERRSKRTREH